MSKRTIAIDFDGVLHTYDRGWQDGAIYGDLMPGTRHALSLLSLDYRLVVFTARYDLEAVRDWLRRHGVESYFKAVTNVKPAAAIYLDDRAVRFISWDQALTDIQETK